MFLDFFTTYEKPVLLMAHFLKKLNVNVTNHTVHQTLVNHPDYPTMLSLSDALNSWKVNNAAVKVEKENLVKLPTPFIAHFNADKAELVLVTQVKDDQVTYTIDNKKVAEATDDFKKKWSGVTLLAEKSEASGEDNFKSKRQREIIRSLQIPVLISILVLFSCLSVISYWNSGALQNEKLALTFLMLGKLVGILVTSLLLWYEIDKNNPTLNKICTAGAKTNCNAVLNSKQAKLFSWLSWSEVGFIYFASGFVASLVAAITASTPLLDVVILLNLLALPYTVFSVFYQWRVVKQWCVLCLSVQLLLLAEFIVSLSNNMFFSEFNSLDHLNVIFLFLLLVVFISTGLFIVKPLLLKNREANQERRELVRLKADPQIWESLLVKQKTITASPDGLGITLGNPTAGNTIIKVCNPYCGPCAQSHPKIEKLLNENPNIKVQILFTATNNENDNRALPVRHLLAIAEANDEQLIRKALDDWYMAETKNYNSFAEKYPMNGELKQQNGKVEAMSAWCSEMKIAFTPTFFVNGYQLPDVYSIGDLRYILQ